MVRPIIILQVVLIQGCGPSAVDLVSELSNFCTTVYFSHRGNPTTLRLPGNVIESANISHVADNGSFVLEDGTVIPDVDTFIPCTGYSLNFPFLSPECDVVIEDNAVQGLFKHIFHIRFPSLSFVGLTWKNTPIPAFHQQCQYISKVSFRRIQRMNF